MNLKNNFWIIVGVIVAFVILVFILQKFYIPNDSNEFEKIIMSNPEIKAAPDCKIVGYCGGIAAVNCRAEVDGPFYYINKNSGEIISKCGGYCLTDEPEQLEICRTMCPPKEWNC